MANLKNDLGIGWVERLSGRSVDWIVAIWLRECACLRVAD